MTSLPDVVPTVEAVVAPVVLALEKAVGEVTVVGRADDFVVEGEVIEAGELDFPVLLSALEVVGVDMTAGDVGFVAVAEGLCVAVVIMDVAVETSV